MQRIEAVLGRGVSSECEVLVGRHVAGRRRRAATTATLHVIFLEKLSKVAQRSGARGAGALRRAIREAPAHVWCLVAIGERIRVRKVKVEYLSLLFGLLVFTSQRCDNEVPWSRSLRPLNAPAERDGRRCARASEPPPAPARPALISLPAAGKRFACAAPCWLRPLAPSALRRTRIFLDNSANNLFAS